MFASHHSPFLPVAPVPSLTRIERLEAGTAAVRLLYEFRAKSTVRYRDTDGEVNFGRMFELDNVSLRLDI